MRLPLLRGPVGDALPGPDFGGCDDDPAPGLPDSGLDGPGCTISGLGAGVALPGFPASGFPATGAEPGLAVSTGAVAGFGGSAAGPPARPGAAAGAAGLDEAGSLPRLGSMTPARSALDPVVAG
ncbi:hypothetical protein [uncultured Methylobacterium sp.]|uniref:hypothetical protein n=1 Tax=uncultured Methylobacterium sp. TaxID=157278 RepID=UPI0035CB3385